MVSRVNNSSGWRMLVLAFLCLVPGTVEAGQVKRITDPAKHVYEIKDGSTVLAKMNVELHLYYSTDGTYKNLVNTLKYKLKITGTNGILVTAIDLKHKVANTTKTWVPDSGAGGHVIPTGTTGTWTAVTGAVPGYEWDDVIVQVYIKCPSSNWTVEKTLIWDPTVSGRASTKLE